MFNRHDRFIRAIYSRLLEAEAFFKGMLGVEHHSFVNWDSLRRASESYVTEDLKEFISDLVFWADWVGGHKSGLIFLFEHKSGNFGMPLRLQVEAYLTQIRLEHYKMGKPIPLIIPIIFYHGKEPLDLESYVSLPDPKLEQLFEDYLPSHQNLMIVDLNEYTDEELLQRFPRDTVGRVCVLMKHIFDVDLENKAHEYLGNLGTWVNDEERRPLITSFLLYLKEEFTKRKLPMEALNTTARQAGLNYEDPMKVFATEYIEEGKAEGKAEERHIVAKAMKAKGYPNQEIAELTGLSLAQIEAM